MYRHIVIEADNLDEACKKALSDDIDWDTQEMDCDSARATTITEAKVIPEGYEAEVVHSLIIAGRDPRGLPLDMLSLAAFLYEEGARALEPSGHRDRAGTLSKNRLAVLGAASVGVLSARGARPCASSILAPAPPVRPLTPCTQKRVGAEASGEGNPPLLT
jgi:hypothetical protein